jgi:hypothetical protein
MRKDEPTDACLDGERSGLGGGQVTMGTRDGRVALEEGGLDHERVGIAHRPDQSRRRPGVAYHHELGAFGDGSQHILGIDRPAAVQRRWPPGGLLFPDRAVRDAEL